MAARGTRGRMLRVCIRSLRLAARRAHVGVRRPPPSAHLRSSPQAVRRQGGFCTVAGRLGLRTQRRQRRAWADVQALAAEVLEFIRQQEQQQQGGSSGEQGAGPAAPARGRRLPTHRELAAAGRHDLRCAQRAASAPLPPAAAPAAAPGLPAADPLLSFFTPSCLPLSLVCSHGLSRHGSGTVSKLLGIPADSRGRRPAGKPEAAGTAP